MDLILKSLLLKTLELIYHIIFSSVLVSAPLAPLSMPFLGSEGILKGKLILFLNSPPSKSLELMYHMICSCVLLSFAVTAAAAADAAD